MEPLETSDGSESERPTKERLVSILDHATLAELRELSEGDPTFFSDLVQEFVDRTSALIEQVQQALCEDDFEQLILAAHTLKGSAKNIGAMRLGKACSELEVLGRERQLHSIPNTIGNVQKEFGHAQEALQEAVVAWSSHQD